MLGHTRIVSLREMLLTYSRAFAINCADLEMTRGMILRAHSNNIDAGLPPDAALSLQLRENVMRFVNMCDQIPSLSKIKLPAGRLLAALDNGTAARKLVELAEGFQLSLFDELDQHVYYHVEASLIPYYDAELPFGDEVFEKFPSATDDIRNAGRCIALGQGTAAVFHLMLVLELGLAVLARSLRIPYAPSWEGYLKQINDRMAIKHAKKSAAWRRDEPFYRDVAGDLQMIKLAWRNPTMHIVRGRSYDAADAENIYKATRSLMQRLATRFREDKKAPPPTVGLVVPETGA